jgi:hypothetical protein
MAPSGLEACIVNCPFSLMKIPVQQAFHYYTEMSEFKYLCSQVTYDIDYRKDVLARITAENQFYQDLSKFMKPRCVSKHTKLTIYTTIIKHIVLCGCETWVVAVQVKCGQ